MASSSPISLRVSNKKAYVWDVDDIATLRSRHHICGVLTGTLPHLSQQNVFLGVPLLLMPEEVVLLVDKGRSRPSADLMTRTPTTTRAQPSWRGGTPSGFRGVQEQLALAEEHAAREALNPDRAMSEQAILKRKEREEKRALSKTNSLDPSQGISGFYPPPNPFLTPPTRTPSRHGPQDYSVPMYLEIRPHHTRYTSLGRHLHSSGMPCPNIQFTTLAAARDTGIWHYPETPTQRARCGVFQDLWERGHFLGGGIKFGGEYLVYPGMFPPAYISSKFLSVVLEKELLFSSLKRDPLRYHSHFVASVIESPAAPLRPMEIVAHGRLGTGTKKAHLLCEWDEDKKAVTYYSIEWAGFG
ncbi:hypothetical protein J3R83DRAFT_4687 [Lanmaoa asiatica]|nr:hypothetical protein J3R83DRAFT_4687 [Lanmaoa asiatica]